MSNDKGAPPQDYETFADEALRRVLAMQEYHRLALAARERGEEPPPLPKELEPPETMPPGYELVDRAWAPDER